MGKGPRQPLGETSKTAVWASAYNPRTVANRHHHQSVTKLQLWFHVNTVLLHNTWNVVNPGAWLVRPPPGAQQSQDFSPILSMVLQILHTMQAVTHRYSQSGQYPGRLEARSETCSALSLKPKLDDSFNFPNSYPLQYSCLKNSMDRGACWAIVHGVTKTGTWLRN